jgi:16S rRNA (cytosine967-C5)-methyltransferase
MAKERFKSARTIARTVLNQFDARSSKNRLESSAARHNYAGPILNKLLEQTDQKQQATDLVLGTIRNGKAIDMVIAKLADCPVERIPAELLNIIRIGVYELIYSPGTAEYAIVNEAVNNTRIIGGEKQAGFVNAVLRQVSRGIKNRHAQLCQANVKNTLPQNPWCGCEFDKAILPESKLSPADYFSTAFSLPKWLVADWLGEFGFEKTQQICFASNRKPSIYIRPNRLKTNTLDLAERFYKAGVDLEITLDKSMLKLKSSAAITELPGFAEGLFSIQDITASQAVRILQPQPDWTILDLCAAPGGKTMQLAEMSCDKAAIIATDIDNERLKKVKENVARLQINSVNIIAYEQLEQKAAETGLFDAVLVDAPCSNTGVLSKRPEVRYRLKPQTIRDLAKIQAQLLKTASRMIKPAGKICYSTCSIQRCENSELVRSFLKDNQLKLEFEQLVLPSAEGFEHDGGYVAIIVKNAR